MDEVQKALEDFRNQRDWGRSVRPDSAVNLSKSVAIEAAKLLEHFQWSEADYDIEGVGHEMADIYVYLILLANHLELDLNRLALEKITINEDRFPPRNGQKTNFEPYLDADKLTTKEVLDLLVGFRQKRDWGPKDSPANFAKSILIEAAELLEHFQWSADGYDLNEVKYEIADVYLYLLGLTNHLGFDLDQLALDKLAINEGRFPAPE